MTAPHLLTNYKIGVRENFQGLASEIKRRHFPLVYGICCSCMYISTSYLTSIHPLHSLAFVHVAFVINQLVQPLISFLEPYKDVSLVWAFGAAIHLSTTALLSNIVCALFFKTLRVKQIVAITAIFTVSFAATKHAVAKWHRSAAEKT